MTVVQTWLFRSVSQSRYPDVEVCNFAGKGFPGLFLPKGFLANCGLTIFAERFAAFFSGFLLGFFLALLLVNFLA